MQKGIPIRLLARQADHLDPGSAGITDLHHAAFFGLYQKVKELLAQGALVNATDNYGWTPLHDAAIAGHKEIVGMLLKAGAFMNVQDNEDFYTPLHDAARMNHQEIVQILIKAGADTTLKDRWNNAPLDLLDHYKK